MRKVPEVPEVSILADCLLARLFPAKRRPIERSVQNTELWQLQRE